MKFLWALILGLFCLSGLWASEGSSAEVSTSSAASVDTEAVEPVTSTRMPEGYPQEAREILSLYEEGQKKAAFKMAKEWLKENKKSHQPWVISAALYCQEENFKKCLKYGKKALKRGPQSSQAYYWRGRAYEGLNKPLEAANEFRAALYAEKEFSSAEEGLHRVMAQLQNQNQ